MKSSIEYCENCLVAETIPIATTVHPVQIIEQVPQDPYDVAVAYVVTPEKWSPPIEHGSIPTVCSGRE